MRRVAVILVAAFCTTFGNDGVSRAAPSATQPANHATAVWEILRSRQALRVDYQTATEQLRRIAPAREIMPILALYLFHDAVDASFACYAMLSLDVDTGAPLLLASIPASDSNVRADTFRWLNRRLLDGHKVAYRQAMHDAAVRCLESEATASAGALLAIGLTGSDQDIPLLRKWYANEIKNPYAKESLRAAARAALVRIGSDAHRAELLAALPKAGARIQHSEALLLSKLIEHIGYTQDRRFTEPLLGCLEVTVEPDPKNICVLVSPASNAAAALDRIYRTVLPPEADVPLVGNIDAWKAWAAKPANERGTPPVSVRQPRGVVQN